MSDLRVKGPKSSLYMEALRSRAKIAAELGRLVALANRNHEMMVEDPMRWWWRPAIWQHEVATTHSGGDHARRS